MHFGQSNRGRTCTVNGRSLASIVMQRVKLHNSLIAVTEVDKLVKKVLNGGFTNNVQLK